MYSQIDNTKNGHQNSYRIGGSVYQCVCLSFSRDLVEIKKSVSPAGVFQDGMRHILPLPHSRAGRKKDVYMLN